MAGISKQDWLEAVTEGRTELGFQEWRLTACRHPSTRSLLSNTDVQTPLRSAQDALENGFYDEAMLSLGIAQARLSRLQPDLGLVIAPEVDGRILFPDTFTRFEVIDYTRKEEARCFVNSNVVGGEIAIQDNGRTAKLFLQHKD